MGEVDVLVPFRELLSERFDEWAMQQDFPDEQLEWLVMIRQHLVTSLTIEMDDFELSPFHEKGGRFRAVQVFGKDELKQLLDEINEVVAA